jgi:hypothetical protein
MVAVDRLVPTDATIGVLVATDDFDYPLYGPRLSRRLIELQPGGGDGSGAGWLIVSPRGGRYPHRGWTARVTLPNGWLLFRRA